MKTRVFVVNPANGEMVSPAEWLKSENPTAAEWLVVENVNYGFKFKIHKNGLGEHNWNEAVGITKSAGGRLPNRFEMISLYNAIYTENLNNVIEAIGGEVLSGWFWTEEEDEDPQYSSTAAWHASLYLGYVNYYTKTNPYPLRVVSGFFLNK